MENVLPREILELAAEASCKLIPEKSSDAYERAYKSFCNWRSQKSVNIVTESVILAYLNEKSKILKPNSLWSYASMLKKCLRVKEKVNIGR